MEKITYNSAKFNLLGDIIFYSKEDSLVYIELNPNKTKPIDTLYGLKTVYDDKSNKDTISQMLEYLAGKRKDFNLKTKFLAGTEFEKKVWSELAKIPYGEVISYKELADNSGSPKAYRAVGSANSKNPLPIIYPCHRVINSNGALGGYSGGLEIKKILLRVESLIPRKLLPR